MIDSQREAIENAIGWLREALRLLGVQPTAPAEPIQSSSPQRVIAWGKKVSQTFRERVLWIADDLGCDPDDLMACMAWRVQRHLDQTLRMQLEVALQDLSNLCQAQQRA